MCAALVALLDVIPYGADEIEELDLVAGKCYLVAFLGVQDVL